jgi:penicillin amidase
MGVWATEPSTGYFANWNNAPVFGWRAGDEAMLWGPVQRVQQIDYWAQRMLAEKGTLGWSDIARLNWLAATHDSLGLPFMPHLIAAAGTEPELSAVRSALLAWNGLGLPWRDADGDGRYDDPAHAIWDAWMQAMLDRVERDELGDLAHVMDLDPKTAGDAHAGDHGTLNNKLALVLKALEGNTAHDWCDDRATPATESCADAVTAALRAAQVDLTGRFGPDVADWLVPVHTSRFTVLGAANADERPMINRGSWVQVVALGEGLDGAGSAMPPSNTGRVNSVELVQFIAGLGEPPRLTRELDMYWTGEYKPFPLGLAEVEQVTTGTETLVILPSLV